MYFVHSFRLTACYTNIQIEKSDNHIRSKYDPVYTTKMKSIGNANDQKINVQTDLVDANVVVKKEFDVVPKIEVIDDDDDLPMTSFDPMVTSPQKVQLQNRNQITKKYGPSQAQKVPHVTLKTQRTIQKPKNVSIILRKISLIHKTPVQN